MLRRRRRDCERNWLKARRDRKVQSSCTIRLRKKSRESFGRAQESPRRLVGEQQQKSRARAWENSHDPARNRQTGTGARLVDEDGRSVTLELLPPLSAEESHT